MEEQEKVLCPDCPGELKISYPDGFLFNRVEAECPRCGFKDSDDGYSNGEAFNALIERLNNRRKKVFYYD